MKIIDFGGQEVDDAWLRDTFGYVTVTGQSDTYHVSELRAIEGPASIVVTVQSADGSPRLGIPVTFSWPDGNVLGYTDGGGAVGFGMGGGAYYWPPGPGPHWVTVDGLSVHGLGMIAGTAHAHINPTFRAGDSTPEPEPPTQDDTVTRWATLFEKMDRVIELLEGMA